MVPARTDGRLRVALAQIEVRLGDLSGNLARVAAAIEGQRGAADLIVFPELTLTGYDLRAGVPSHALRRDDRRFAQLVEATAGVAVQVGFIEESDRHGFHNSVALIADRRLVAVHRKIYLPTYGIFEEGKHYARGRDYAVAELAGHRVAPFICADAWNPPLAHLAAMHGADLFTFSVASPAGGLGDRMSSQLGWKRLCRFYASIYGVYVVFCNRVGAEGDLRFWGESEIVDPFGETVAAAGPGEQIAIGELSRATIREARTLLPTMRDDDPDFLRRQLDRLARTDA